MAKTKDYQILSSELDDVVAKLQRPDVQVDEAVKLYEQGLGLITDLETHLKRSENKIQQLKLAAMQTEE